MPRALSRSLPLLLLLPLLLAACSRSEGPAARQSTPDEVVSTAQALVRAGRAERLPELLLAEDPRMRELFRRMGVLLGSLQQCSLAFAERQPEEVARLREEAGRSPALAGLLNRRRGNAPRDAFNTILARVLADPFAALDEQAAKITTVFIDDNTAAVLYDNQPVLPPLGLVMTRRDGKWFVVPPLNAPFIGRFLPQTDEEYAILAYLIKTLDNAVREIQAEVAAGRITDAPAMARAAGERLFIPASMVLIAYGRAIEARTP